MTCIVRPPTTSDTSIPCRLDSGIDLMNSKGLIMNSTIHTKAAQMTVLEPKEVVPELAAAS